MQNPSHRCRHSQSIMIPWADPEVERGSGHPPSLKNHKHIGFLRNTGPDPTENHKDNKQAFNVGPPSVRQRNTI